MERENVCKEELKLFMIVKSVTRNFVYPMGGIEEHIYNLAVRIKSIDEIIATKLFSDHDIEKIDNVNIRRFPFHHIGGYCYSKELREYLNSAGADIIHGHGWGSHAVLAAFSVAKNKNLPIVITPYEFYHTQFPKNVIEAFYNKTNGRKIIKNSTVIAVTKLQKEFFDKFGGTVCHIPCGVDIKKYSLKKTSNFKLKYDIDGDFILSIGRISRYKRFDMIIKAVSKLDEKPIIVIAGKDWGDAEQLKKIAIQKNVDIIFVGQISEPDKISALMQAGVYVSPSQREGFGITLIEALACNTKVLATPVGIAPDLPDEFCEMFKNENELSILIEKNLNQKVDSRSFIESNYTWEFVAKKTEELYESL